MGFAGLVALALTPAVGVERAQAVEANLLWQRERPRPFASPVLSGGVAFVGSEDHSFTALDARTGEELWSFRTAGAIRGAPLVTASHVYFESDDRRLYKVERARGGAAWSFEIGGSEPVRDPEIFFGHTTSTPALRDGRIHFGSGDGRFYCLDDADGSPLWSFAAAGRIRSAPVFAEGRVIVAAFGPVVYALEEETGAATWERSIPLPEDRPVLSKVLPSPVVHEGLAILGFRDGSLRAFEVATGRERWVVRLEGSWVEATGLVIGDRLYIGSSDAAVVRCYRAQTGEILWETTVGGRAYGRPSRFGDHLLFGLSGAVPRNAGFESGIAALVLHDGRLAWRLSLPRPRSDGEFVPYGVLGDTSVEGSLLCFSDASGSLYAYELRD